MHRPFTAAIARATLAVALLAASASAGTLGDRFSTLSGEVQSRLTALTGKLDATQKKQKAALGKAGKALAANSTDLVKALANSAKTVAALDPLFGTDGTIGPLLDDLVTNVEADVADRKALADYRDGVLPDGKTKTAVANLLTSAGDSLTAAGAATTRKSRLSLVKKALGSVASADRSLAKARKTSGVLSTDFEAFADGAHLFAPRMTSTSYQVTNFTMAGGSLRVVLTETIAGKPVTLSFQVAAPSVGEHPVALVPFSRYTDDRGATPATAGTVKITTWDPANMTAAGTFEITYSNATATIRVTKGAFTTTSMTTL